MSHKRRWTNYWNPYTKYMACGVASVILVCLVLMLGAWACPHYLRCSAVSRPSTAHDFMHRLWESTNHTQPIINCALHIIIVAHSVDLCTRTWERSAASRFRFRFVCTDLIAPA